MENADVIAKARLLASSTKESGAWLRALPVSSLGLLLDDAALRIAVALRLGAPICEEHRCICGQSVDTHGLHGLSCKKSRGRHGRHAALNELIKRALASAVVPSVLEPVGLDRGDGKRPDGLTSFTWRNGKCLIWDVTCVDTMAVSYIAGTSDTAGSAADEAERRKTVKYQRLMDHYHFSPLGFETFGSWGESAKALVTEIAGKIQAQTGEARSAEFLRQRISIELQRGNAASVLGTVDTPKSCDEFFFLLGFNNF